MPKVATTNRRHILLQSRRLALEAQVAGLVAAQAETQQKVNQIDKKLTLIEKASEHDKAVNAATELYFIEALEHHKGLHAAIITLQNQINSLEHVDERTEAIRATMSTLLNHLGAIGDSAGKVATVIRSNPPLAQIESKGPTAEQNPSV
jgi:small-conductance mechanosensitive channel